MKNKELAAHSFLRRLWGRYRVQRGGEGAKLIPPSGALSRAISPASGGGRPKAPVCLAAFLAAASTLQACSVYPVAQDPDGLALRRNANEVMIALQAWHREKGGYPERLASLVPTYLPTLPDSPVLRYRASDGSLSFRYIPTWPQLRPVWCNSIGNTTIWRCEEHII